MTQANANAGDMPARPTCAEYEAFVSRHAPRNIAIYTADGSLYAMGMALAPVATVMPKFVSDCVRRIDGLAPWENRLGGLLVLIMTVSYMMPQQIWAAKLAQSRPRIKSLLLTVAFAQRVPWLVLAAATLLIAPANPSAALVVFFVMILVSQFIQGMASPIWLETMAKTTPLGRRGFLYGLREACGAVASVAVIFAANSLVPHLDFPANYAFLFAGMFFFVTVAVLPLIFIAETDYPVERVSRTFAEHFRDMVEIVKTDARYRRYYVCKAVSSVAGLAPTSLFAMRAHAVLGEDATLALIMNMTLVVSVFRGASFFIAPLGDRFGYRFLWMVANVLAAGGTLAALFASSGTGFYVGYALATMAGAASWCASSNYMVELAPLERRPSYIGLDNMSGLPFVIMPFIGGWLADVTGSYAIPFGLAATAALAAAIAFRQLAFEPRTSHVAAPK